MTPHTILLDPTSERAPVGARAGAAAGARWTA